MSENITTTKLAIFKGKEIRKTIYNNEWWFVVEDVVLVLIDSKDPKKLSYQLHFLARHHVLSLMVRWLQVSRQILEAD